MKTTDVFKQTILTYLEGRAASDSLFAASFAKAGKTIDDCSTYILNTVQKSKTYTKSPPATLRYWRRFSST